MWCHKETIVRLFEMFDMYDYFFEWFSTTIHWGLSEDRTSEKENKFSFFSKIEKKRNNEPHRQNLITVKFNLGQVFINNALKFNWRIEFHLVFFNWLDWEPRIIEVTNVFTELCHDVFFTSLKGDRVCFWNVVFVDSHDHTSSCFFID